MGCCCKKKDPRISTTLPANVSLIDTSHIPEERQSIEYGDFQTFRPSYNSIDVPAKIEDFKPIKVIGKGSFGEVILVKLDLNNKIYAMKVIKKKSLMKKKQIEHTQTERKLLEKLKHPFIIKLNYAFQDSKKLYFLTEFIPGGELFFHLRKNLGFSENEVRFYSSQLLIAIEYMHNNNYIYRDLKPENILIDKDGNIKLTDFGLSKILPEEETKTFSICGTAEYLAPEILLGKGYDKTCDWFSFGVVIFEMFCGYHPFKSVGKKINMQRYYTPLRIPDKVGNEAKDLIHKLLIPEPYRRLGYKSVDEIKNHPFFKNVDFDKVLNKEYEPPFKPDLNSDTDLKYFDKCFTDMTMSVENKDNENNNDYSNELKFDGFSFQHEEEENEEI